MHAVYVEILITKRKSLHFTVEQSLFRLLYCVEPKCFQNDYSAVCILEVAPEVKVVICARFYRAYFSSTVSHHIYHLTLSENICIFKDKTQ